MSFCLKITHSRVTPLYKKKDIAICQNFISQSFPVLKKKYFFGKEKENTLNFAVRTYRKKTNQWKLGGSEERLPPIKVFIDSQQIHFLIFLQILPLEMSVFVCHISQQQLLSVCVPVWVRVPGLPPACPSKPSPASHHRVASGCEEVEGTPGELQILQAAWSSLEWKPIKYIQHSCPHFQLLIALINVLRPLQNHLWNMMLLLSVSNCPL